MYTVRFSTKESGWVDIGKYETINEAVEEYENQIGNDVKEGYTDNWTQIIDNNGQVIEEHFGEDY